MKIQGADISEHQGRVNFSALKRDVDFVIARSSWGMKTKDKQFDRNQRLLRRKNIPRWFYHYSYPNHNTPESEADHFVNTVGNLQNGESLVLDMEEAGNHIVNWSLEFLNRVENKTGVKPLIYMNSNFLKSYGWKPVKKNGNGLWIANFGANDGQPGNEPGVRYWEFYALWQYTSQGTAGGIHPLDLNLFYGSVEDFKKYGKQAQEPTRLQKLTRLAEDRLSKIKNLRQTKSDQKDKIKNLKSENKRLKDTLDSLETELDDVATEEKELLEVIENLEDERDELKLKLQDHRDASPGTKELVEILLDRLFKRLGVR